MDVRISRGHFEPAQGDEIDRLLRESGDTLIPAIRRLAGNLHYDAAIDRASARGVRLETIINYETLWQIEPAG